MNFHSRWGGWDRIEAIFLNLFYFNKLCLQTKMFRSPQKSLIALFFSHAYALVLFFFCPPLHIFVSTWIFQCYRSTLNVKILSFGPIFFCLWKYWCWNTNYSKSKLKIETVCTLCNILPRNKNAILSYGLIISDGLLYPPFSLITPSSGKFWSFRIYFVFFSNLSISFCKLILNTL